MALIEVRHLLHTYEDNTILADVTTRIRAGHFYALLGKNGVGKTTFLRLLSRLIVPRSGVVEWVASDRSRAYADLVILIDENASTDESVLISDLIRWSEKMCREFSLEKCHKVLKDFRIPLNLNYMSASRGQKIQLQIALAYARNPAVYLLDEVTSVLDAGARLYALEMMKDETKKGKAIVVSTNVGSELNSYADHLLFLENKKLVEDSGLHEITSKYKKFILSKQILAQNPKLPNLKILGSFSETDVVVLTKGPVETTGMLASATEDRRKVTLEDIYTYETGVT